jgi:limonene 1,2-monooxygenase
MRPDAKPFLTADEALHETAFVEGAAAVIGTPDDLIAAIRKMLASSGGFGTVLGFAHDWANRENTLRSWDLVARYVMPEVNGMLEGYRASRAYVVENREWFNRAGQAVLTKIMSHEGAAAALKAGMEGGVAMRSPNAPDLKKAAADLK